MGSFVRDGMLGVVGLILWLGYVLFGIAAAHEGLQQFGAPGWLSVAVIGTLLVLRMELILVGLTIYGAYAGWHWNFFVALIVFAPAAAAILVVGAGVGVATLADLIVGGRQRKTAVPSPVRDEQEGKTASAPAPQQLTAPTSARSAAFVSESARPSSYSIHGSTLALIAFGIAACGVLLYTLINVVSHATRPSVGGSGDEVQTRDIPPTAITSTETPDVPKLPPSTQTLVAATGLRLTVPGQVVVKEVLDQLDARDRTKDLVGAWDLDRGEDRQYLTLKVNGVFVPPSRYADTLKSPSAERLRSEIEKAIRAAVPHAAVEMIQPSSGGLYKALLTNMSSPGIGECLVGAVLARNQVAEVGLCSERAIVSQETFDTALASLASLNPSTSMEKGSTEEHLYEAYGAARARLTPEQRSMLLEEQRSWIAKREADCGVHIALSHQFFDCLNRAAAERIEELTQYVAGGVLPKRSPASVPHVNDLTQSSDR